jgi:hypothetical protein
MALLNEVFEVSEVPQGNSGDYSPLPDGWYSGHIAKAELCTTKAGTGHYIKVRYDITGPTHQGRVVFGNFNVHNPSVEAEKIGRQQLADLCRAIGLARVTDTDQLVGHNCQIKLTTRQQDGYEPSNEIKGWKAIEGGTLPRPALPPTPAPAQRPASSSTGSPPWAKK